MAIALRRAAAAKEGGELLAHVRVMREQEMAALVIGDEARARDALCNAFAEREGIEPVAYAPNQALAVLDAIAPYRIDFAEQPVRADDFAGMALVQSQSRIPLMAHEGAFGLRDLHILAEMGAVRTFGLNGERPGGMSRALKAIDYAAARGLDVVLHNQPSGIGSAIILHMHAARARDIRHATELQGHIMLEDDLILDRITYEDGFAHVPTRPGWGVDLDDAAIDRYLTHPPVSIVA